MQLSVEDYKSLVDWVQPEHKRADNERRCNPRVNIRASVTVILLSDEESRPIQVIVVDVSRTGLGFRTKIHHKIGDQFLLCMTRSSGNKTRAIICEVKRVSPLPNGEFQVGCSYIENMHVELPPDEIFDGLSSFEKQFIDDAEAE
jgi:hypothetical protein